MKSTSLLAFSLASSLVGCSTGSAPPSLGMANPASVYCMKLGGKLTIENTANGQVGICRLPDGTQIEEWELFRRDHSQK
ncbi:MAG: DUF333 domain-containing protein [Comamonas sp.]